MVFITQVHCDGLQVCLMEARGQRCAQVEHDEVAAMGQVHGCSANDYWANDIPLMASNLWMVCP